MKGGYQKFFKVAVLFSLTEGPIQNFKTLAQPLLGEFGWGFLFLLLPRENKVNSQVWPVLGVSQYELVHVLAFEMATEQGTSLWGLSY